MATKTKSRTKKGSTTKTAAKAKATATNDGPSKRELAKARDAELTEQVLEAREEGQSWSEIAADLSITPGKAQFLMMLHRVATGDVKPLRFKDDETLTEQIKKARTAADEFSSWGWIAARTGVSEVKIKRLAEEDGFWSPKSENIAVTRAERHGDSGTTTKAKRTTAKAGTDGKASKAAKAKARAKRKGNS